jgi:hypothetical protein
MRQIKTMKGKHLDVTPIMTKNENKIAIGNANMNARGDILGPGGTIIKRREEVAQEYHNQNPRAVRRVSLKEVTPDTFLTPAEVIAQAKAIATQQAEAQTATPVNTAPKSGKKILKDDFKD